MHNWINREVTGTRYNQKEKYKRFGIFRLLNVFGYSKRFKYRSANARITTRDDEKVGADDKQVIVKVESG